jgi:23S rRNA (adenine2030-N6)-methyltransferase
MNYRHIYHAGNFADVFKHVVLIGLVQHLLKKEKPFCFMDTHAGTGRYDLTSEIAKKTGEFNQGVSRVYHRTDCPSLIKDYQDIIKSYQSNTSNNIVSCYPGSPLFVYALLREQDRMILSELHPADARTLKQEFWNDDRVAVHQMDGYQSINAFLPIKQGRGLILIDPPFEKPDEFKRIFEALNTAYKKFPHGLYAIWYPMKEPRKVERFHHELQKIGFEKITQLNFSVSEEIGSTGLVSCGLTIINPPFEFEQQINPVLSWLRKALAL